MLRCGLGGSPDRLADVGHAEADGVAAGGGLTHGLELLSGGGQGGLDRGDFTEPALFPGLLKAFEEISVDLLQASPLGRVNSK